MNDTNSPFKDCSGTVGAAPSVTPELDRFQYKIYSDLSEVRGLSQQWEDLLATSQCNKAFGSLEWYLASCRMDTSGVPYVIAATRGAEVTCILALLLNRTAGVAKFPAYGSDYNDVLVRGGNPQLVADLLRYAISADTPCRHLILSKLRPDSNCLAALCLIEDDPAIECRNSIIDSHFYVELPPDFEDYLAYLGREFRRNVRRTLRAAAAGGLTICELHPRNVDPVALPNIYFPLFMCRHIRLPLSEQKSISEQVEFQSFVREVLPTMFRKGALRVFAVIEDGRILAVLLAFISGQGFLTWSAGFLTGKERWSPGTALYAFAIRQAIAEGLHEVDFGDGDEAFKQHWTKREYGISEVDLISNC